MSRDATGRPLCLTTVTLRCAHPQDGEGIRRLIAEVYAEHGDQLLLDGAEADLIDVISAYGRSFVVLDCEGEIGGCHAVAPVEGGGGGVCTFRRLYLAPSLRGGRWGRLLMQWAIERARLDGYRRVEFWSDTRFTRAHHFFRKMGFASDGRRRTMHDGFMPYDEFFFSRAL